jgi:hypothetical protein
MRSFHTQSYLVQNKNIDSFWMLVIPQEVQITSVMVSAKARDNVGPGNGVCVGLATANRSPPWHGVLGCPHRGRHN